MIKWITVTVATLLLTAAGLVFAVKRHTPKTHIDIAATNPVPVQVGAVTTKDIPQTVPALGSLSAVNIVTLSAQTDGRISAINFRNGQLVEKGMPVIALDDTQAQATFQEKKTAYELAKQKYEAYQKLQQFAVSVQQLRSLKADVATMKAQYNSAFAAVQQMKVVAPFTGVLGAFKVNQGDYITAGSPIVTLVNSAELRVDYNLPEVYLSKLKQGQLVSLVSSAYPKQIFYGTVTYISPTISQSTRTVAVQASVPNKKNKLSPGMFVQIKQRVGVLKNVVVVPEEAVLVDVKGNYVYLVKQNKVQKQYITIGQHTEADVQVTRGLSKGDAVVITGQQKLEDGTLVEIKKNI